MKHIWRTEVRNTVLQTQWCIQNTQQNKFDQEMLYLFLKVNGHATFDLKGSSIPTIVELPCCSFRSYHTCWQVEGIRTTVPYRIAGNFWGRKPLQISQFCGCLRKFSPQNLGVWHPLAWHKQAIHESFLCENHIFHQFAKVFSLESFPLYGILLWSTHICSTILPAYLSMPFTVACSSWLWNF